jgi:hypothetical protein
MGQKGSGPSRSADAATLVLDAGTLIALERGSASVRSMLAAAKTRQTRILIPAGVLAQVWRGARQAALGALLTHSTTTVVPLDRSLAMAVGLLLGDRQSSDVVDAAVVIVARRERGLVVTGDVLDLLRLDPGLAVEAI